jgi:hypothetical protein
MFLLFFKKIIIKQQQQQQQQIWGRRCINFIFSFLGVLVIACFFA